MFTRWLNRMFRGALQDQEVERIRELREVKSMLSQVVEQIRQEGRQETARNMLQEGLSLDLICRTTGFSKEQVERLTRTRENKSSE